jgi:hypothetical protein
MGRAPFSVYENATGRPRDLLGGRGRRRICVAHVHGARERRGGRAGRRAGRVGRVEPGRRTGSNRGRRGRAWSRGRRGRRGGIARRMRRIGGWRVHMVWNAGIGRGLVASGGEHAKGEHGRALREAGESLQAMGLHHEKRMGFCGGRRCGAGVTARTPTSTSTSTPPSAGRLRADRGDLRVAQHLEIACALRGMRGAHRSP